MMKKLLFVIFPAVLTAALLITSSKIAFAYSHNNMIDDAVFDNTGSMSSTQIDSWLNAHFPNSCISTNSGFSAADPTGYSPDANFIDGHYSYGARVSAGKVIYDAAKGHSINPQVLLTKLENEENLVSGGSGCSNWRLASAMGYACPDSLTLHNYTYTAGANPYTNSSKLVTPLYYRNGTPINSISSTCVNQNVKAGFSEQVVHAAWLLSFTRHKSEGQTGWAAVSGNWNHCEDNDSCPAGDNIPANWACYSGLMTQGYFKRCPTDASTTYYDGYATIDGSAVHIDTGATAALYVYTPHFQSFDSIFSPWFGSPTGSMLFKVSGNSTYYLDWGGYYYPVPSTDMLYAWGLARLTPRTVSSFPAGETKGPTLSRVVKFGSDNSSDPDYTATITLVDGGLRHDAPNWSTLNAHGYSSYVNFPASLEWSLSSGDALRPVVRQPNGAIFVMIAGQKRGFPDWQTYSTLSGPNYAGTVQVYSQQSMTNMSSNYISSKPDGAPMLLDGKFIKPSGSPAIYLYDSGKKYLFSPASYAAWGGHTDYSFSQSSINQITNGGSAPTLVSSSSGSKYLVDLGKKKQFNVSSEAAWGLNDGQFTTVSNNALGRLKTGTASTLVTPGIGVYYIQSGIRHGIGSLTDFNNLGFNWSNVDSVSNSSMSLVPQGATLFAPGSLIRTPNGAVSVINANYSSLGITSGVLFSRFGFSWSKVRNVGNSALSGYTQAPLQTLLQSSVGGNYYEVENGVRHYIDTTASGSGEYDVSTWPVSIVDPKILTGIKNGAQLTRFIRGSGPTVYYIENGQRRGITTESEFNSLGGSWSEVVNVSNTFLSEIPRGSNI